MWLRLYFSVQISRSVVSHGLQHAGPPCPSPTPGVYPDSCPLSRWCHPVRSDQIGRSVVSDCLQPHESQHARPPCPSPTPGVYPDSCPLSRLFHPAISSSAVPFSFCPQSFPALGFFPMSWLFASGGQSIGASVSAAVHPMNIQGWFPWGLTSLISPCPRDSQESSPAPQYKNINSWAHSLLYDPVLTSCMTTGTTTNLHFPVSLALGNHHSVLFL